MAIRDVLLEDGVLDDATIDARFAELARTPED